MIGLFLRAKEEQKEQQECRDQNGQADRKRAAPKPDVELFDVGGGWNRGQRKQSLVAASAGQDARSYKDDE